MLRGVAIIFGLALAVGAGLLAGYLRWGSPTVPAKQSEQGLQALQAELSEQRAHNHELEQRLEQIGKEQERLAQENEILRKEHTTEQLLGGGSGELPARPPK
jgi:Na+-translocating ferredoxin:NAD+ oxidoreductase RnfG subunit